MRIKKKDNNTKFATKVLQELILIIMWVGVWGVCENIIDKYVPQNSYNLRVVIFTILLSIAIIIKYYYRGSNWML
jgi:ABC-type bacteriocin/lantibiotic exporter with double-glycine peptidase domain